MEEKRILVETELNVEFPDIYDGNTSAEIEEIEQGCNILRAANLLSYDLIFGGDVSTGYGQSLHATTDVMINGKDVKVIFSTDIEFGEEMTFDEFVDFFMALEKEAREWREALTRGD